MTKKTRIDSEQHTGGVSQPNGGWILQTSQSVSQQYACGRRGPNASLRPLSNWIDGIFLGYDSLVHLDGESYFIYLENATGKSTFIGLFECLYYL